MVFYEITASGPGVAPARSDVLLVCVDVVVILCVVQRKGRGENESLHGIERGIAAGGGTAWPTVASQATTLCALPCATTPV